MLGEHVRPKGVLIDVFLPSHARVYTPPQVRTGAFFEPSSLPSPCLIRLRQMSVSK